MIEPLESRIAPAALLSAMQIATGSVAGGGSVVATDSLGDIIVAGAFFKSFSPGAGQSALTTSDSAGDLYIVKYSPTGAVLWATTWGGTGEEIAESIAVDGNNDIFITGGFSSTNAGFGGAAGSLTAHGSQDAFLIKLNGADGTPAAAFNGSGALRWGGTATGAGLTEAGLSVAVDGADRVIVAGLFNSTDAGFDGSSSPIGSINGEDAFVFRVDGTTGAPDTNFGFGGMTSVGADASSDDAFLHVIPDAKNDLFLAYKSSSDGFAIMKVNGTDGTPAFGFGEVGDNGTVPVLSNGATTTSPAFDIGVDHHGEVVSVVGLGKTMQVSRYDGSTGAPDQSFGNQGLVSLNYDPQSPIQVTIDQQDAIYVSGNLHGKFLLTRINAGGTIDPTRLSSSTSILAVALDPQDTLILRGTYLGNPDLDPTNTTLHLPARSAATLGQGMTDGYVERVDPYGIDAGNPLFFTDTGVEKEMVTLNGPGMGHATLNNFGTADGLDGLTLSNTTLASNLHIQVVGKLGEGGLVDNITTTGSNQSMGTITLGHGIILGDGTPQAVPDLHVSGQLNALTLDGLNQDAIIELGDGVPAAATVNNHPSLTIGDVMGSGVEIDVLGDKAQDGTGGGGLGNVLIHSWTFDGLIQTTRSIGNFTVEQRDFAGVLHIGIPVTPAPFLILANHPQTASPEMANVGEITVENGAWGSSGSEIQGNIESFDATGFLAGASIEAGSIGTIKMTSGQFAGSLMLTDAGAAAVGTFSVNSDFSGSVISAQPLKKIKIKGDFTGSLQAPGVAGITAYAFLGIAPADPGDPLTNSITVTDGVLGAIKSTAGIIEYYSLVTPDDFGGISVNVGNLTQDTIGIEDVSITAASIGNIGVHLAAARSANHIHLTGIDASSFTTTNTGTAKGTIGSIGNIAVTISGNAGVAGSTGISNSTFDAQVLADEFGTNPASTVNPLGKIAVKLTGAGGTSLGLDTVTFASNSIGATSLSVTPGNGGTAAALDGATYTADHTIGAITVSGDSTSSAVQGLNVWAGGAMGAISIASKTAAAGSLLGSSILAGQDLSFTGVTDDKTALSLLRGAALGAVTLSGSLSGTTLAAGSNLGAIEIGGTVDTSDLLAGSLLGTDHALGGGDDSFQRAADITSVTVKGAFTSSTIAAGAVPGTNGFGDPSDALGAAAGPLTSSSQIGSISLGGGALLTSPAQTHQYVIEAATIKALIVPHTAPVTSFTAPILIDVNGNGEDTEDSLVRLLS